MMESLEWFEGLYVDTIPDKEGDYILGIESRRDTFTYLSLEDLKKLRETLTEIIEEGE